MNNNRKTTIGGSGSSGRALPLIPPSPTTATTTTTVASINVDTGSEPSRSTIPSTTTGNGTTTPATKNSDASSEVVSLLPPTMRSSSVNSSSSSVSSSRSSGGGSSGHHSFRNSKHQDISLNILNHHGGSGDESNQHHRQSSKEEEEDEDSIGLDESGNSRDYDTWKRKRRVVQEALDEIQSESWHFQRNVDLKAREHLKNLLLDYWPSDVKARKNKVSGTTRSRAGASTTVGDVAHIISNEVLQKQFEAALAKCKDELLFEYEKWTKVTGQDSLIANGKSSYLTALLLLLMVFGEVDLIRTQNRATLLLFHMALKIILSEKKANVQAHTLHDTTNPENEACVNEKSSSYKLYKIDSVGSAIRYHAKWVYNLMLHSFDKNLRNEQFFDWDDLNDLSWTPGFVKNCLSPVKPIPKEQLARNEKDLDPPPPIYSHEIYAFGGFEKAFKMKQKFALLNRVIHGFNTRTVEEKKALKKEKAKFARLWKTYFDCAGGWFGWRGYLTYFINFFPPIYYQLVCLSVALAWMFNCGIEKHYDGRGIKQIHIRIGGGRYLNLIQISIAALPLAVCVPYFVLSLLLGNRTKPSLFHPHRFSIPRRDTLMHRYEFKMASCNFLNIIPGYILSVFHLHLISTVIISALLTALYITTLRYVLFESVRAITIDIISLTELLITGQIEHRMNPKEYANIALVYASFALMWISLIFVFVILPPIVLSVCAGLVGFVKGYWLGVSRVNCWSDLRRCFHDKNLILRHFRKKLLADRSPMNSCDRELTETAWATVWNAIIEEFYENHECSKAEKNRLSYKLRLFNGNKLKIVDLPDLTMRPISEDMRRHLIKFVNNLYMRSMPDEGVKVIDMKRLVVFTPVFREKIFYSWEELIQPNNTGNSFLRALIYKYPHEWRNFKEKEFPQGNRLRKTVDYIEAKVLAGIDITQHSSQKVTTTQFMKRMIQAWASQRFQPVSRTVKGFMRYPKALSILLRLQNPELTDEQVRTIIRQKFSYVVGAQLYDKSMWNAATNYDDLPNEASRLANQQEHLEYVQGLDLLCKTIGDSMLKVAFMTQTPTIDGIKYKSVLKVSDSGVSKTLYELDAFNDFSRVGQGKPTNQGHMLQFFDGTHCQTVDCNQDATLSQSFFVPNILKEFDKDKKVKIIGFPEDIFTKNWSYAGYAAAFTERVFGSIVQRVWSMMNLRFHYGHPDFLRGAFVMFTTSLSKLSYISEDVFNGFDMLLNGGKSIHVEYMEVGKARDVCMLSTSKFNRKTAGGAAQIACSRYPHAILTSRHFTFLDKLMFCYSVLSHYSNTLFTILAAFVLYATRVGILILILVTIKAVKVSSTLELFSTVDIVSGNMSIISDSLYLFQMGMTLSVPGILQMILDRGLFRGVYEYVMSLIYLLTYSMFQLMNTCFYFHYGFNQSAKYIASGRVTGLQHTSITEIFRTFKNTHFYPAAVMVILQIIGISTGGSWLFLIYHTILIFIWLFSPFLFNEGSFPTTTSGLIWKKLYAEDNFRVKWWLSNDCPLDDVEKEMEKSKLTRASKIEYQFNSSGNANDFELDLESNLLKKDVVYEKNYLERNQHADKQYSMFHMQNQIQRKRNNPEPTPSKKEKKKKVQPSPSSSTESSTLTSSELDETKIEHQKLVKFGKRRRFLHFYLCQPFQLVKRIVKMIPKVFLLLILYGTKLIAYFYQAYRMISPWSSPPGYEDAYKREYEEKILESRIMNMQRVFWFMKKDINEVSHGGTIQRQPPSVTSASTPNNILNRKGMEQPKDKHRGLTESRIGVLNDTIDKLCQNMCSPLFTALTNITKIWNMDLVRMSHEHAKMLNELKNQLQQASMGEDFAKLCQIAADYVFAVSQNESTEIMHNILTPLNDEVHRKHVISCLAQWYLIPFFLQFVERVEDMSTHIDKIIHSKSMNNNKVGDVYVELVRTGNFIMIENRTAFEKIVFSQFESTSMLQMNHALRKLLTMMIDKCVQVSERAMTKAKKNYDIFAIKLNQTHLFDVSQNQQIMQQRIKVREQLELSLNNAKRLTERKNSKRHIQVEQFTSRMTESQILMCDVFEGDNGQGIFAQMFPLFVADDKNSAVLSEPRRRELQLDRIELFDALTTEIKDRLLDKRFLDLESNCLDMLEFMDKSAFEEESLLSDVHEETKTDPTTANGPRTTTYK